MYIKTSSTWSCGYGVATISRLLKIIKLFCKRALQKRLCSAKETYYFKEPTNRSHPVPLQGVREKKLRYRCGADDPHTYQCHIYMHTLNESCRT